MGKHEQPHKRTLSPVTKPEREQLFNTLMENVRRYNSLEGWEKCHVISILLHKVKEQEKRGKE